MKGFNLSAWALDHQPLIRYLIVVLMLSGVYAYFALGRMEEPAFTMKAMVLQVSWPGATAEDMAFQVADKLEKELQETPWLDFITSYSKPGESTLMISLQESTPRDAVPDAWYQVRKKVNDMRHELPSGVIGPFFNDEFGDVFGSIYAFNADGFDYAELEHYVDRVRQELLRLDQVSKVEIMGEQEEKIYVEVSDNKLASLKVSPLPIFSAMDAQNAMEPAGRMVTASDQVPLRVNGDFDSLEGIRGIGIEAEGRIFRLGDIADVRRGYVDPAVFKMRFNGREAIGLGIAMREGGNILELGKTLEATMARLQRDLPVGIEFHQVSNQPQVVKESVNDFMKTFLEALAIVIVISLFSLGLRTGLVVALSIPLVLAMTFLIMKVVDIDLQRISLGALVIALGLLVDDAIIAIEMMALKLEQGWDRVQAATFAYSSAAFPMLTGTLITVAGFLPIGLARSSAGEYTFSIFAVVGISLLVSWVVAVVFTPYIGYKLLSTSKISHDEQAVYQKSFYRAFRWLVEGCLRWRWLVILLTAVAFAVSLWAFQFVPQQFFPESQRPELIVDMRLPEDASFAATEAQVKRLEAHLVGDDNIVNYVSYVGGGAPRFFLAMDVQQKSPNFAQLIIMTKDEEAREAVLTRLRELFKEDFPQVLGRVSRLPNGPTAGYPVQFRVSGENPDRLRAIAADLAELMRANPYTRNVNNDWNEMIKVMRLEVDQDKARQMGVSTQDVSRNLHLLLNGLAVTQYREGDKLIDVVIRARPEENGSFEYLEDLNVHTSQGRFVPLGQLVRIHYSFEPGIIRHRNRSPAITVQADIVDGVQAPDVTTQIDATLEPLRANLPDGYRIEVAGTLETSQKSQASIFAGMPLMGGIILTLLMIQLRSFSNTLLVILTAPLGMIGVSLFLLIFQQPFGFVAMLGVISLSGMIMRNSVILVDQIQQDIAAGLSTWEAIVDSTVRRFRPIMLTAFTAILAMIPLTQSAFWAPMAVAIMGGLLVATLLTLLFLPALYAAWFRVRRESKV